MVFDSLSNCKLYYGMHPRFQEAFDFIKKAIAENLEPGKYEIDGKELWASVQEYTSKLEADAKAEAHKNYIDIQFIVKGEEIIAVAPIQTEKRLTEAKEEKDVWFYECDTQSVILKDGDFMVLYPSDLHLPGKAVNQPSEVLKVVIKVRVD